MHIVPFVASACATLRFIPHRQDPASIRRLGNLPLQIEQEELAAAIAAGDVDEAETARRRQMIADKSIMLERIATEATEAHPNPTTVIFAVPTGNDRDLISVRLTQSGVRQSDNNIMRAMLIEELFEQDWEKGSDAANVAHAEELANRLDDFWEKVEIQQEVQSAWAEKERQRILDIAAGAPFREPDAQPMKIISVRETAFCNLTVDEMITRSARLRKLIADGQDFQRRQHSFLARMHIVEILNLSNPVEMKREPMTGLLLPEVLAELRDQVGDQDWAEIIGYAATLYEVKEEERKNSDSPLAKPSPLSGSSDGSGDAASSVGKLTASNIEAIPDAESGTITAPSSAHITRFETAPADSVVAFPIQTDGA